MMNKQLGARLHKAGVEDFSARFEWRKQKEASEKTVLIGRHPQALAAQTMYPPHIFEAVTYTRRPSYI